MSVLVDAKPESIVSYESISHFNWKILYVNKLCLRKLKLTTALLNANG